jgi:hypothetical protein
MNNTLRQILVVIAVLAVIGVNIAANALPINGLNTGDISDRFDILFVPAGYVFSIWGLIYLGLLGYAVYQVLPAQADNPRLQSIGGLFLLSSAANIVWIFLWHYLLFPWTLIAMITLLLSLIGIYVRLRRTKEAVGAAERWLVRVPFSIYLGWISVATIANISQVLYYIGWSGWGVSEVAWAIVMLVVGVVLAGVMAFNERDPAYVLVFVWAYAGIGIAQADEAYVAMTAWGGTAMLALLAMLAFAMSLRRSTGTPAAV